MASGPAPDGRMGPWAPAASHWAATVAAASQRSFDPLTAVLAGTSGALFLAYFLPLFSAQSIAGSMGFSLSSESGSWPMLAIAVLAALAAVDHHRLGRAWLTVGAGVLTTWAPYFLITTAIIQAGQDEIANDGGLAAGTISYGSGWFLWLLAFFATAVTVALGVAAEARGVDAARSPAWAGLAVGIGGLAWFASMLIPEGDMSVSDHVTDNLFGGPFLTDLAVATWLGSIAVFSAFAAARRTAGSMAAVAGLAGSWALLWSTGSFDFGQVAAIDSGSLFGVAMGATGTIAALSALALTVGDGRISTLPVALGAAPADGGPTMTVWRRVPSTMVVLAVGIPVAALAGFA